MHMYYVRLIQREHKYNPFARMFRGPARTIAHGKWCRTACIQAATTPGAVPTWARDRRWG